MTMIRKPVHMHQTPVVNRRVAHCLSLLPLTFGISQAKPSFASGILQYPLSDLNNTYYLIRAGETLAEAENRVLTNPVAKTSMSSGLSDTGKQQVYNDTYSTLKSLGACDNGCWIWPSMHMAAYQTGEILAARFGIGRNRLVPEFSKLDARGVGALEGGQLRVVSEEIAAGDALSSDWRPPKGDNGTPHESLDDVMVRGRELLSLLETQFQGDTVLLISPDSYNLSILQAAVAGVDLRGHEQFAVASGGVRELVLGSSLGLSVERDDSPKQIPCPRPPMCK